MLDGSAWSTARKYMRRCKGNCDIFFGIEDRLRKEEIGGTVQQRGQAWIFAGDTARITDERASSEDQKHTSGGVFLWQSTSSCGSRRRSTCISPR